MTMMYDEEETKRRTAEYKSRQDATIAVDAAWQAAAAIVASRQLRTRMIRRKVLIPIGVLCILIIIVAFLAERAWLSRKVELKQAKADVTTSGLSYKTQPCDEIYNKHCITVMVTIDDYETLQTIKSKRKEMYANK